VAIQLEEGTELIGTAQQGSKAAHYAQATLEISLRRAATTELHAQSLTARFPRLDLAPANDLGDVELL